MDVLGRFLGVCRSGWDWVGVWRFRIGFWDAVNADDIADADVLEVRKLEI